MKKVYIVSTKDYQENVIETLEKWGGENSTEYTNKDIFEGEKWLIMDDGKIGWICRSTNIPTDYTEIKAGQEPEIKIEANNDQTLINALAIIDDLKDEIYHLESRYDVLEGMADDFAKERNELREKLNAIPKFDLVMKGDKDRSAEINALFGASCHTFKYPTNLYAKHNGITQAIPLSSIIGKLILATQTITELPPKEEVVEFSLEKWDRCLVRNGADQCWYLYCFVSFECTESNPKFITTSRVEWSECIPFNDENKELIGKIGEPTKTYKHVQQ